MGLKLMEQMELVAGRLGDDQESTLLDRYERLSFEVQLNQAILGRSLSQPATFGTRITSFTTSNSSSILSASSPIPHLDDDVSQKKPGPKSSKFQRFLSKLFSPKKGASSASASASANKGVKQDSKVWKWKTFSRSLRA